MPRFNCKRGDIYGYGYGHDYGSNEAMREKKGGRKNTAPSGTNRTTSSNITSQDPNPLAEGIKLGLCTIEEVNGLNHEYRDKPETNERPTKPERPETPPPKNPVRH